MNTGSMTSMEVAGNQTGNITYRSEKCRVYDWIMNSTSDEYSIVVDAMPSSDRQYEGLGKRETTYVVHTE